MVSYLPNPSKIGEMKTKPTQTAARTLNSVGLQADIIMARSNLPLDQKRKDKIAIFCNIRPENVISAPDVDSIYDVPINLKRQTRRNSFVKVVNINHKKHYRSFEMDGFCEQGKSPGAQ